MWSRRRAYSWHAQGPGFDAQLDGEERKKLHYTRTPSSVASISAHPHCPWDTKASWPFVHANSEVHVIHSGQKETLRLGLSLESMTGLTLKKKSPFPDLSLMALHMVTPLVLRKAFNLNCMWVPLSPSPACLCLAVRSWWSQSTPVNRRSRWKKLQTALSTAKRLTNIEALATQGAVFSQNENRFFCVRNCVAVEGLRVGNVCPHLDSLLIHCD